jgi:uncharacterized protein YbjT (DUF2867 family)
MRVLVTGAAGTLGTARLPHLQATGHGWLDELRGRPDERAPADPPWP